MEIPSPPRTPLPPWSRPGARPPVLAPALVVAVHGLLLVMWWGASAVRPGPAGPEPAPGVLWLLRETSPASAAVAPGPTSVRIDRSAPRDPLALRPPAPIAGPSGADARVGASPPEPLGGPSGATPDAASAVSSGIASGIASGRSASSPGSAESGAPRASAPPPLDLNLPRHPGASWRQRPPALDDPRANSRAPRSVEALIAAELGDGTWTAERLDNDRIRYRSGGRCVMATRSRAGQLNLANGAFNDLWNVRDC